MVYNVYNIPLERVVLLFETNNKRYLSKIWLPEFILNIFYRKFIKVFNDWFNNGGKKRTELIINEWYKLRLKNNLHNVFPALYVALAYAEDESAKKVYEQLFGKFEDIKTALERIQARIVKTKDTLGTTTSPKEQPKGLKFAQIIPLMEFSRNVSIDRKMTLFDFKQIYTQELTKWQQQK